MRDHGQDLPVARVHGHHRAAAVSQGKFRRALNVDVDGQLQILPWNGVLGAQVAHLAAVAVHDHIAGTVLPAQQIVVGLLHARLAHHVARLVGGIARIVQILLAHLAHIADQVRRKAVPRVKPPLHVNGFQLGQLVAVRLDEGLLVGADVLLDGNRLVMGCGPVAFQRGAQLVQIEVQPAGNQRQVGVHIAVLLADQKTGDRGVVVHQQVPIAVEELAAGGQHRNLANAVLLGELTIRLRAQHLQPPQSGRQHQQDEQNAVLHRCQLDGG